MRKLLKLMLASFICATSLALPAQDSGSVGRFLKQVPGTDRQIPITSALMSDKVYFEVRINVKDGEHSLFFTVYDGNGKQVLNAERIVVAKDNVAGSAVSYGFDPRRDAPGTWWYVVAVDNEIMVSSSIPVIVAEPNNALKGDVPKGTHP